VEHLQHFGLSHDPFGNEPDLRFYFDSARHRDAIMRVERGLRQNKGLTVLSGEPGTGKTLLTRRLLDSLEEEVFEVVLLVMLPGATDAQTVLSRFARQLGVEEPGADRSAMLAQIYEQLAIVREDGRHTVLIIDDAHILAADVMAEVGGLLNMEYEDSRLISLLLVGAPELDVVMSGDAALNQRVDVRVHLHSLDLDDTAAYLAHRLTVVGGRIPMFPSPTIEALFKYSRGRPRLINTLADNALFEAYLGGRSQVDARDVERAAGDLGVGTDPGETYAPFAVAPAPPPSPMASSQAPSPGGPDLGAAMSLDPISVPTGPEPSVFEPMAAAQDPGEFAGGDISSLLEVGPPEQEELTTVLNGADGGQSGAFDLDAEMNAILSERDDDEEPALPIFEAENDPQPAVAEATRIVLADEEDDLPLSGGGDVAELDDLFVELIDE